MREKLKQFWENKSETMWSMGVVLVVLGIAVLKLVSWYDEVSLVMMKILKPGLSIGGADIAFLGWYIVLTYIVIFVLFRVRRCGIFLTTRLSPVVLACVGHIMAVSFLPAATANYLTYKICESICLICFWFLILRAVKFFVASAAGKLLHCKLRADNPESESIFRSPVFTMAVYAVLAVFAFSAWFDDPGTTIGNLLDLLGGTAKKPFAGRILFPVVLYPVGELLPLWLEPILLAPLEALNFASTIHPLDVVSRVQVEVWMYLSLASLVLLGMAMRRLASRLYDSYLGAFLWGGIAIALWPALKMYIRFAYDPPTPALVAWVFVFMLEKRRVAFWVALALVAVHKETAIVLPLAFFYIRWMQKDEAVKLLLWQLGLEAVLIVSVRIMIAYVYWGNSLAFLHYHLDHNIQSGFLWSAPGLVMVLLLVLVCCDGWLQKPVVARGMALVGVPLLALGMFWGYFEEIRQYAEAYPGLMLLAYPNIRSVVVKLRGG